MNSVKTLQASQKASERKKGMPKEAIEFAKKMGINISGLEAEAQDIWKMLETMSDNDPIGYAKFMQEHLDKEKMEEEMKSAEKEPEGQFFRPVVGFCVEMQTCGGNDGMKIREINQKSQSGKSLYVNMTSHKALEPPKDQNTGRPISLEGNRSTADGLELPLAIGPVRDHNMREESSGSDGDVLETACLVVDVVVHPYVVHQCSVHLLWLNLTMGLVVEWVEQERRVTIAKNAQGKHAWTAISRLDSTYRGAKTSKRDVRYMAGRGDNGDVPVLFPVNYTEPDVEEDQAKSKSKGFSDPSDILQHKGRQREQEEDFIASSGKNLTSLLQSKSGAAPAGPVGQVASDIKLPFDLPAQSSGAPASKVPFQDVPSKPSRSLVQELGPDGAPVAPPAPTPVSVPAPSAGESKGKGYVPPTTGTTTQSTRPTRKAPSIPKGFLNNPKAAGKIYGEEGGDRGVSGEAVKEDERVSGAKGGSYARFMDRCQVVNSDNSGNFTNVEQPKNPFPKDKAAPPPPTPAEPAKAPVNPHATAPAPVKAPELSEYELRTLEEMYEKVDDDFENLTQFSNSHSKSGAGATNDDFAKQLEQFGLFSNGGDVLGQSFGEVKKERELREAAARREKEAAAAKAAVNHRAPPQPPVSVPVPVAAEDEGKIKVSNTSSSSVVEAKVCRVKASCVLMLVYWVVPL